MSDTAHIRQFGDNSLEHRVQEYRAAREGHNYVMLSQELANDPKYADTLGEQEDIDIAEEIMKTSLSLATGMIGLEEVSHIVDLGLMTQDEAQKFSEEKQKQEFREKLKKQRRSISRETEQDI